MRSTSRAEARWIDTVPGSELHFGWVASSDGRICAMAKDIDAADAMVWMQGREIEYVMHGPCVVYELVVSSVLVEQLGWTISGHPLAHVGEEALRSLTNSCNGILNATTSCSENKCATIERDSLLDLLDVALAPWSTQTCLHDMAVDDPRYYQLVRTVDEYLQEHDFSKPFLVDQLADALDLPRRTIFWAFRRHLGIGPRRYFEIMRLNRLRHRLKRARHGELTVQEAAKELCFPDLCRLPALYRKHFGELPSDTLCRTSPA